MSTRPSPPRVELLDAAVGIGTGRPRLSWTVSTEHDPWAQTAYEVELETLGATATSGRIEGGDSVLLPWPFESLVSRATARVRARVWGAGDTEPSEWGESSDIEVGLLEVSDWDARPIASPDEVPQEATVRFRREFVAEGEVVAARLYITALGVFQAELNGVSVGDDVLSPGWTVYSDRLRYSTYDVTSTIRQGANAIGMTVAEGWFRGRLGFRGGVRDIYGTDTAAIAQLELRYADGSVATIATDDSWRCGRGPVVSASLYDGETYDARLEQPGWSLPDFDDTDWASVQLLESVADRLVAPIGPPVKRHEVLRPTAIWQSPAGKTLVDFGQNISGRVRIHVRGEAGTRIEIKHAEVLEDGELGTRPLRLAAATDTYVLGGRADQVYEPLFTIHGFRYAQVDGWPGMLDPDDIAAIACYSAIGDDGGFECSHPGLNQLHANVRWSMKGNFVDIPTDCPQRDERLGWTGDIEVFAPTASFLADCAGFLGSWLQDLAVEQRILGTVPPYVPWVELIFPPMGTAAWSDAAVIVPWTLYEQYGDVGVLERQFHSMKAWVDHTTTLSSDSELWDQGFQFGDWLDPAAPPENPAAARTETALVATAYRAQSARLLSRAAAALGRHDDAAWYGALADRVVAAFNHEFVTPTGRLSSDAQTAYALALGFELLASPEQRERAGRRLRELVAAEGYRIGTGFVGTPLVCDALADGGHVDDLYFLLLQEECPSWLYPVSMGATTIWERWDSMLADGSINPGEMTSFNHYALGAVADFLHRRVAGRAPAAPGYRRILVSPLPGGGLTHASAYHRTPYGMATVAWRREAARLLVDVTVPPSTTATVVLPGIDSVDVGSGTHHFEVPYRPAADDPTGPPAPFRFEPPAPPIGT